MADGPWEQLIKKRKNLILIGSGGVGKTSCSLGLAVFAARAGKRVGLLSIDPAKRLASAMGIELGGDLEAIPLPHGQSSSLHAAMLDSKAVFDAMVKKHAPDPFTAQKILAHPIYIAASTKLAGPGEYMALAKFQEMLTSDKFDFIVLDTPPDTHALDFLDRPNILSGFMENKVMSWLVKPFNVARKMGVEKLLTVGEKLMGGLSKVTGLGALSAMTEFLALMQQVIEGFHQSSEKILQSLRSEDTGFVLVAACQASSYRSAKFLTDRLLSLGYTLDGAIFNRTLPLQLDGEMANIEKSSHLCESLRKSPLFANLQALRAREKSICSSFEQYLHQYHSKNSFVLRISEHTGSLHSLENICDFSLKFQGR